MYKLYIRLSHDKSCRQWGLFMIEQTMPATRAFSVQRMVVGASSALLAVERIALMGLMYLLTGLILVNVVTRYSHFPIYWIDESAVYCVVWLTFIGASAMTRLRLDFAVTMLTERLSPRRQKIAKVISTGLVVVFGIALIVTCVLWMDPIGLARAGFDGRKLAAETFNFVYTEHTQTLNWPTWVLYLTLPIFAVSMTVHGLANLLEDLELVPRTPPRGFALSELDGVN
ncbi:C4-dicarboxylate ABC transporter permease [Bradyrhizobium sp. MOS002]|nr:C4-dicarboxylate ABC transporter permease [Bradyrhizobium sp. MOS002]